MHMGSLRTSSCFGVWWNIKPALVLSDGWKQANKPDILSQKIFFNRTASFNILDMTWMCFWCIFWWIIAHISCFRFEDRGCSGVPGEMAFLSAWIVSSSAVPFLFLIWGKRIKCHCETIIAATAAFSSPIHVPAMQLRNKPWPHWCRSHSIGLEAYIHTHIHRYTQHSTDQQKCFV